MLRTVTLECFLKLFFSFLISPLSIQPSLTLCTATKPQIAFFPHPVLFIHPPYNSGSAPRSPLGVSNPFGTAWKKAKRDGGIGEWETCLMREIKMRVERPRITSRETSLICFQSEGGSVYSVSLSPFSMTPLFHWRGSLKVVSQRVLWGNKGQKLHSPQIPIWSLYLSQVQMTWEDTWVYRKAGRRKLEFATTFYIPFLNLSVLSC